MLTSKARPSSKTPARPTHIRTNSGNQSGGRRRKDTEEDPAASFPPPSDGAAAGGHPGVASRTAPVTSSRTKAPEHSFLTDVADVREMEKGLLSLLDDFHSGKLQAFGSDDAFKKMDAVREQQEQLARMHFRLDQDATAVQPPDATTSGANANGSKASSSGISDENMDSLLTRLHTLSQAIQDLHPEASVSQIPTPLVTQASGPDHNVETDGS